MPGHVGMPVFFYLRLTGYTAGALLYLLLMVLILGHRRPRALEQVLFFLVLSLFLVHSGGLLGVNLAIHYTEPPVQTLQFAVALVVLGLTFLPALLVHVHAEYYRVQSGSLPAWCKALAVAGYLPLLYFVPLVVPNLLMNPSLEFLSYPAGNWVHAYGLWLTAALVAGLFFQLRFGRHAADEAGRRFHRTMLAFFGLAGPLTLAVYGIGIRPPEWSVGLGTLAQLSTLVPGAVLSYFVLRHNFLQIGVQRNLVYAVTAAFLALLYLAVVRRISGWLEPYLPPEATISILIFVLVFFFEPLQRRVSRVLRQMLRIEVDRLQRLTAELQQEARNGDLPRLVAFAETRIRQEFSLADVLIVLSGEEDSEPSPTGPAQTFPLRRQGELIGLLRARPVGAFLSGETQAALAFLAEQLPAALDLCRLIGDKLRLERELAERERLALLGQMAATISHNLKNPLGSMKTVLQVQLENPSLSESLRRDCAMVVAEIDRLGGKLAQLLRYARPAVRPGASAQRVSATAQIEAVVELLRREADRRQVTVELVRPGDDLFVLGSEEGVNDIVSNLLVNAIEAVPVGGRVQVKCATHNTTLVVEVSDDGPGIPADIRPKVLQPFFTTKASGTGLGLAIVERRLAEMGGAIEWQSPIAEGRGTRFIVTLPLADARA